MSESVSESVKLIGRRSPKIAQNIGGAPLKINNFIKRATGKELSDFYHVTVQFFSVLRIISGSLVFHKRSEGFRRHIHFIRYRTVIKSDRMLNNAKKGCQKRPATI